MTPPPEPAPEPAPEAPTPASEALSVMLRRLADDGSRSRVSLADLVAALGERALAPLLFLFAFPNVLPMPPGTSSILGAPLLFLAAQLMLGQTPWLPGVLARRSMSHDDFARLVRRIGPWLQRGETLLRPRLMRLALPPMEQLLGAVCLLLAVLLVLPIPLGNMLPALAISLLALGVLERDGLWVLAGLLAAVGSVLLVSGVVFAMAQTVAFVLARLWN